MYSWDARTCAGYGVVQAADEAGQDWITQLAKEQPLLTFASTVLLTNVTLKDVCKVLDARHVSYCGYSIRMS